MCFLSRLHAISLRGPWSFKRGFQEGAGIPGHRPQAWQRRVPPGAGGGGASVPVCGSWDERARRYCVSTLLAPRSAPKLHASLSCQVQYSFLSSFSPSVLHIKRTQLLL